MHRQFFLPFCSPFAWFHHPSALKILISAFIQDIKKGTLSEVNTVLDRIYGKATQQVELGEKKSDIPEDPEERRALAEQIKKEWQKSDVCSAGCD